MSLVLNSDFRSAYSAIFSLPHRIGVGVSPHAGFLRLAACPRCVRPGLVLEEGTIEDHVCRDGQVTEALRAAPTDRKT